MKIADSDSIKSGEKDLIDSITADLDWGSIEELLEEKHNFKLQDDVDYKTGDMMVYDNQIAYKLDFDIKVSLSVIFNRDGECLKMLTSGDPDQEENQDEDHDELLRVDENDSVSAKEEEEDVDYGEFKESEEMSSREKQKKDPAEMASKIADMIHDINKG